jgi:hypothetical protein
MAEDISNSSAAPMGSDDTPNTQINGADASDNSQGSTPDSSLNNAGTSDSPSTPAAQPAQAIQPGDNTQSAQPDKPDAQPGTPDLSKAVIGATGTAGNPASQPPDPAVKAASRVSLIAEALTGGPRYTTTIDPNTGVATRTRQPVTAKQVGLAIALQALQGGLAGFSVANGPGNLGRAAAAGAAVGSQQASQVQQKNQQQEQQAQGDFQRHAQVLETNMKLYNNAQQAGRADFAQNEQYVGQFAPRVEQLMHDHPEVIKGVVNGSDLAKYHVTQDSAIPYKVVARINPPGAPNAGEQTVDASGKPQWDIQYAIVDPNFKSSDALTDADKKLAVKLGMSGFADADGNAIKLPQDLSMKLSMATGIKSKLATYGLAQNDLNDFYSKLNNHDAHGDNGDGTSAAPKSVFQMFGQDADGNPNLNNLADFIEKHEGSKPGDRNQRNNNAGNLVADASWTGKTDNANLPAGQTPFRVYDSPEEGKAALLKQLQIDYKRTPNMSPEDFFAKYDKNDAATYAADARKAAGVNGPTPTENPLQAPDLAAAIKADPTLLDSIQKFQPFLNASSDNYEKAIGALGAKDPTSAGKILALYGGTNQVRKLDLITTQEQAQAKTAQKIAQDTQEEVLKVKQAGEIQTAKDNAKAADLNKATGQISNDAYTEEPDASGKRPTFIGQLDKVDPGQSSLLKAFATGDQRLSSQGISRPQMAVIAKQAQIAYPNLSSANIEAYNKTMKDLNGQKGGQIPTNTAFQHLADYGNMVKDVGVRGTWNWLNNIDSNYGPQSMQDKLSLYNQAKTRAASEVEAAYKGGGSSLTDKDKEDAKEMFDGGNHFVNATPSKQYSMAKRAQELLAAKVGSVDGLLANVMPSSETAVQDYMSADAHKAYRDLHDGQDFDSTKNQTDLAKNYGEWYGRKSLDNIRESNGGQAGNGQMQGKTNGQTQVPKYTQFSSSGLGYNPVDKQWYDPKTNKPYVAPQK